MNRILIYLSVFLVTLATAIAVECGSEPVSGCDISVNTTFSSAYFLNCTGESGYCVNIEGEADIYLDCNGTTLHGGDLVTVQMASSGGYHTYLQDCIIEYASYGIYVDNAIVTLEDLNISPITLASGTAIDTTGVLAIDIVDAFISGLYGIQIQSVGGGEGYLIINDSTISGATASLFEKDEYPDLHVFVYDSTLIDGSEELDYHIESCTVEQGSASFFFSDSYLYLSLDNILEGYDFSLCELGRYVPDYRASDIPLITGDAIGTGLVEVKTWIPTFFVFLMLFLIILFIHAMKKKLS